MSQSQVFLNQRQSFSLNRWKETLNDTNFIWEWKIVPNGGKKKKKTENGTEKEKKKKQDAKKDLHNGKHEVNWTKIN